MGETSCTANTSAVDVLDSIGEAGNGEMIFAPAAVTDADERKKLAIEAAEYVGSPSPSPLPSSENEMVLPLPMPTPATGPTRVLIDTRGGSHAPIPVDTSQPSIRMLEPLATAAAQHAQMEGEPGPLAPILGWSRSPGGASARVAAQLAPRQTVNKFTWLYAPAFTNFARLVAVHPMGVADDIEAAPRVGRGGTP